MLWFSSLAGVARVRCPHCGTLQAQPRRSALTCKRQGCRRAFSLAEGEAAYRRYLAGRR